MELYKIKDLTYYYPEQSSPSLKISDLTINDGEFILIMGPSGCGKSTLARTLSGFIPHFFGGNLKGSILFKDQSLFSLNPIDLRKNIGMVFQDPEKQIVMANVKNDLVFGLENLGLEQTSIKDRINEITNLLEIKDLLSKSSRELSSGQKQKIAIASILAMKPKVLILDEPTSQLDPSSSKEIFSILRKLNKDHGYTIILIEQNVDSCFDFADRVIFVDRGEIIEKTNPVSIKEKLSSKYKSFFPLKVSDSEFCTSNNLSNKTTDTLVKLENINFNYKNGFSLNDINLKIQKGELLSVIGENGAGKSTLLKLIPGYLKPKSGDISYKNTRISYLSQNPNDYLFNDTVEEELRYTMHNYNIKDEGLLIDTLKGLGIEHCRYSYPRDLSTGEKQRVALASILVSNPSLIMLDEPTRGLDPILKEKLGNLLIKLKDDGKSIILVTQDIDFVLKYSTKIKLLKQGTILNLESKHEKGTPLKWTRA